jgi:hypothetical protein
VFCEDRQLAQEWTYRFLGAAAFADEEATRDLTGAAVYTGLRMLVA